MSNSNSSNSNYEEFEDIRGEDGVLCSITRRKDSGYLSFRIRKTFHTNGDEKNTAYLGLRHIPELRKVLDEAEAFMLKNT